MVFYLQNLFRPFESASIILPVINETSSLIKTVDIIEQECARDVLEYLIVVCERTTDQSIEICNKIQNKNPSRYPLFYQKLPFLGGAIRDAFSLAKASHVVMMASDLETDPHDVKNLIKMAKSHPDAITTATRWTRKGFFEGYDHIKLVLNYIFQKCFSILYRTNLTDMTYGYRIFPTQLVQNIYWEELKHPFLFETLVKPLRLGVKVHEIPSKWAARTEGESQNTFLQNFAYFRTGIKSRFSSKTKLLNLCI